MKPLLLSLSFLLLVACERQPAAPAPPKIEYSAVDETVLLGPFWKNGPTTRFIDALNGALNDKAAQGWELVQVDRHLEIVDPQNGRTLTVAHYIFKREKGR
jgi:hypothetical protein